MLVVDVGTLVPDVVLEVGNGLHSGTRAARGEGEGLMMGSPLALSASLFSLELRSIGED